APQATVTVTPTPKPQDTARPSTPPEQIEDEVPLPDPARAEHKRENRRKSSTTPPMNFNNPADFNSSSPTPSSAFSSSPGGPDDVESVLAPDNSSDDEDTELISVASPSVTAPTNASSEDSDGSEMDLADSDEITGAFKPWIM